MTEEAVIVLLQEGRRLDHYEWIEAAQGLALLRSAGFQAGGHLVRTARQRDELARSLHRYPPRLIFLAAGNGQTASALAFLNALRVLPPETSVAVGGCAGTLCSDEFTAHPLVEAVVLGDWMESLVEFAEHNRDSRTKSGISGLWWKSSHGWKLSGRRLYRPDLEDWPDPAVDDFHAADLARVQGWALPLHASRGFPFMTLFTPEVILRNLQVSDTYYHVRPPHRIVKEAESLRARLRVQRFHFADLIFPWEASWSTLFAQLWRKHLGARFSIRTCAEHLTPRRLDLLRRAGLEEVELCLDGGNEKLRQRLSDLNQHNVGVLDALKRCARDGIRTRVRLLLGVPGETLETLKESVHFADTCGADEVVAEIFRPWPTSPQWSETEQTLTGETLNRMFFEEQTAIARDVVLACQEIQREDSLARAKRIGRKPTVTLDGIGDYERAHVRSPLEGASRITRFHAPSGSHDVIALRVPAEISWKVKLPKNPILQFGLLIEPALPGERCRLPISFSVKVRQKGKTYRLFQKILVQALDPDSRLWHWFKIPVSSIRPGEAEILLESVIYGHDASYIPPGRDAWAGWTRIYLDSERDAFDADDTDQIPMFEEEAAQRVE